MLHCTAANPRIYNKHQCLLLDKHCTAMCCMQVAALALKELLQASQVPSSTFEVQRQQDMNVTMHCMQSATTSTRDILNSKCHHPHMPSNRGRAITWTRSTSYPSLSARDSYFMKLCSLPWLQVAAVVSQPGKPKGRGNKAVPIPSPVEQLARSSGIADDRILCPKSAREVSKPP